MIKRKVVKQHESFVCTLPRTMVELMGLAAGDEVAFELRDENTKLTLSKVGA